VPRDHEDWLWRHVNFTNKVKFEASQIDVFEPKGGGRFGEK
jgi:hypothetical protein